MIDPTFAHALPPEPDARTVAILDRLTAAHGVIDRFNFTYGDGDYYDDAFDVIASLKECDARTAAKLVDTLAALAALLSDAGSELARIHAENAGLRARCGK